VNAGRGVSGGRPKHMICVLAKLRHVTGGMCKVFTPTPPCDGLPPPSVQHEPTKGSKGFRVYYLYSLGTYNLARRRLVHDRLRAQSDFLASFSSTAFAGVAVVNTSRSRFSNCTMSDSFPSPEQGGILLSHRPGADARVKMFRLVHEPGCARALHCKGAAVDTADPEGQLAKCKSRYRQLQIGYLYNNLTGNGCSAFPMTKWMLEKDGRRYSYWCTARHGIFGMRGTMLDCK